MPKNEDEDGAPDDRTNAPYNPAIHRRRSIRLRGYDYSLAGLYFVTICCDGRKHRFGTIENGEMTLNAYGAIAHNQWLNLTERFDRVELDAFQIMPNHMHGIIAIRAPVGGGVGAPLAGALSGADVRAPLAGALSGTGASAGTGAGTGAGASPAPTLGDIVGAYKSLTANACLKIYKSNGQTMGKLWQRNYWEHIIRNEHDLSRIRHYIENNPRQWDTDQLNDSTNPDPNPKP